MVLSAARWLTRWFFRNWRRNLRRVSTTSAVLALVRTVLNGKPETVFRGVLEPGAGVRIRVLRPGER